MTKLNGWKMSCSLFLICLAAAATAPAQTFNTLVQFTYANGADPFAGLVQGRDGNLYGTTAYGGTCALTNLGCGTVFKMSPAGALQTLHYFTGPDGAFPFSELVLATDGNFYGTTVGGGANCASSNGCGTVFRITPSGSLTTLYSFCSQSNCVDGQQPYGGLIQATNGNLYGTTNYGGTSANCDLGCGTFFRITPAGALTTLSSFTGVPAAFFPATTLVQGANGKLYGTTQVGGAHCGGAGCGAVFSVTLAGKLETIYSFCAQPNCADGDLPTAGLIQATDGNFYGTASSGGNSTGCEGGCGTVFKITPNGALTTLHTFSGSDGFDPAAALFQATDGNFYGTTVEGGYSYQCPGGCGTIFQMTSTGTLTTVYAFPAFSGGSDLRAQLLQHTSGTFFGTTYVGGFDGAGTAFSLNTGLGPFVTFVRAAGQVGQTGGILGHGFTGATAVAINQVPANFKVVSDTYLTATVPSGATTGYVTVTTPSGVLKSNVPFRILP